MVQKPYLLSGQLAKLAGISADTLRHYERMKLLAAPRRSPGNYRLYPAETVDRVRLIQRALTVGFSLPELAQILKIRDKGGSPCRQVRGLLEQKVQHMNEQIRELAAMRDYLTTVLADWDEQLAHANGKPARLLETLIIPARSSKSFRSKGRAI